MTNDVKAILGKPPAEMTDEELQIARNRGAITPSAYVQESHRRAMASNPPRNMDDWTIERVVLAPGLALTALRDHDRRVQDLLEANNRYLERARKAEAKHAVLADLLKWAHDTLIELNPSNYNHDDVCRANDATIEVILGIAPAVSKIKEINNADN